MRSGGSTKTASLDVVSVNAHNPYGTATNTEIYGPPDLTTWLECYAVLRGAFLSFKVVSRTILAQYRKLITSAGPCFIRQTSA